MIFIICILVALGMTVLTVFCVIRGLGYSVKKTFAIILSALLFMTAVGIEVGDLRTLYIAYFGSASEFAALKSKQLQVLVEAEPENENLVMAYFSEVSHGQNGNLSEMQKQAILKYWWQNQSPVYLNLLAVDLFQNHNYHQAAAIWQYLKSLSQDSNTPIDIALAKANHFAGSEAPHEKQTQFLLTIPNAESHQAYQLIIAVRSIASPAIPVAVLKMQVPAGQTQIKIETKQLHSMQGESVKLQGIDVLKYQFLNTGQELGDKPVSEGWILF